MHWRRDLAAPAKSHQIVLAFAVAFRLPRLDGTFAQTQKRIGYDEVEVDSDRPSESFAARASTYRAVERKEISRGLAIGRLAAWTLTFLAELLLASRKPDTHPSFAESKCLLQSVDEPRAVDEPKTIYENVNTRSQSPSCDRLDGAVGSNQRRQPICSSCRATSVGVTRSLN